jgi:hypothetical protein
MWLIDPSFPVTLMMAFPVLIAVLAAEADPTDRDLIVRALENTIVFSRNEVGSCRRIAYGSSTRDIFIENDTTYKICDGNVLLCHIDKSPSGELGDYHHVANREYGFRLGRPVGAKNGWRCGGMSGGAEAQSGLPAEKR